MDNQKGDDINMGGKVLPLGILVSLPVVESLQLPYNSTIWLYIDIDI